MTWRELGPAIRQHGSIPLGIRPASTIALFPPLSKLVPIYIHIFNIIIMILMMIKGIKNREYYIRGFSESPPRQVPARASWSRPMVVMIARPGAGS